jgi:MFS family permease
MRTRCLWLLIAYFCMNMLAMGALMTHMVAHLFDLGINSAVAAFALSVMTGVMTFAQFCTGFVGMRFSMLAIAVSGEVLKIIGVVILISTGSVPVVFVSMVVLGMGFGAAMVATMNIFPNYFGLSNYPKIGFRKARAFVGGAGRLGGLSANPPAATCCYNLQLLFWFGIDVPCLCKASIHPSLEIRASRGLSTLLKRLNR